MARATRTPLTSTYTALCAAAEARGENKDCTVKAIAAATGLPYDQAWEALAAEGRQKGKGAYTPQIRRAIRALGFDAREVPASDFIRQYPGSHKNAKNVTSHHPQRYNKVWRDGNCYVLITSSHALAVVNGENHDWSRGRSLRVDIIYRITKKEQ